MVNIDKETYENNKIEAIVDGNNTLWLNEKHIKVRPWKFTSYHK